jgi:hypothetical protein
LLAGALAALLYRKLDPAPPQRLYSWEVDDEESDAEAAARLGVDPLEPEAPPEVRPIWSGPRRPERGVVLRFPSERRHAPDGDAEDEDPPRTLH